MDHFNRKRFIKVDSIFERAHSEKLAELERIAYSLGAKSCLIEIDESNFQSLEQEKKTNINRTSSASTQIEKTDLSNKKENKFSREAQRKSKQENSRSGKARIYFEGSNSPTRPELKWFANDDIIKDLIEMRCSGNNSVRSRVLTLEGSTSATMSQSIAYTIDHILTLEAKSKRLRSTASNVSKNTMSMSTKVVKESNSKLIFEIEF